ncbi:MAG: TIGR03936 family radical SAM-associated protein [Oscillospiraceae bacterium]
MPSVNTRAFFSKTDRAKYISHLDLNSVMQRAIRRSGLPVWRTEGFNPHTYVQFMLPLSLGQEGLREAVDFRLLEDISPEETARRLNDALPADIRVTEVSVPKYKNTDIASAEYDICGALNTEKFGAFLAQDKISVEKKTKKGVSDIDLKPLVSEVTLSDGKITLRLPAGNEFNINPALLLEAYAAFSGEALPRLRIVRTHIFCSDGNEFV